MNTIARLKQKTKNLDSTLFTKQTQRIVGFLFFCGTVGCQTRPLIERDKIKNFQVSSIDAHFKLRRLQNEGKHSESTNIRVYQKLLRSSLYSQCDYFPSDSAYSQIIAKRCGSYAALFKTFDRFIREPDAGYLGLAMTANQNGTQFVNLPESCDVF